MDTAVSMLSTSWTNPWFEICFCFICCHYLPLSASNLNLPLPQMLEISSHYSFRCTEYILGRGPSFLCFQTRVAPGRLEILLLSSQSQRKRINSDKTQHFLLLFSLLLSLLRTLGPSIFACPMPSPSPTEDFL